jgi:hypothetical protein
MALFNEIDPLTDKELTEDDPRCIESPYEQDERDWGIELTSR